VVKKVMITKKISSVERERVRSERNNGDSLGGLNFVTRGNERKKTSGEKQNKKQDKERREG